MPRSLLPTSATEAETQGHSIEDLWLEFRATAQREDRDRLVLHYTGLITYVASRLRSPLPNGVDQADLIQSGVIGLMDAVDRFEPERGLKFETYAVTRIRGAILDSLRAQDWVPRSVRKRARELEAAAESCRTRLGRTPTAAELADELGVSTDDVASACAATSRMYLVQLDAVATYGGEDQGMSVAEMLADPFAECPGDALEAADERAVLWSALDGLSERDRAVLVHSFVDGLTLAQIGRLLGVTESRVSQLRSKALRELGAALATHLAA